MHLQIPHKTQNILPQHHNAHWKPSPSNNLPHPISHIPTTTSLFQLIPTNSIVLLKNHNKSRLKHKLPVSKIVFLVMNAISLRFHPKTPRKRNTTNSRMVDGGHDVRDVRYPAAYKRKASGEREGKAAVVSSWRSSPLPSSFSRVSGALGGTAHGSQFEFRTVGG